MKKRKETKRREGKRREDKTETISVLIFLSGQAMFPANDRLNYNSLSLTVFAEHYSVAESDLFTNGSFPYF